MSLRAGNADWQTRAMPALFAMASARHSARFVHTMSLTPIGIGAVPGTAPGLAGGVTMTTDFGIVHASPARPSRAAPHVSTRRLARMRRASARQRKAGRCTAAAPFRG